MWRMTLALSIAAACLFPESGLAEQAQPETGMSIQDGKTLLFSVKVVSIS